MPSIIYEQRTIHFPFNINSRLGELYVSFAIRNFALGLVVIFEPIYVYLFFSENITLTFLYFGLLLFLTGILSPFGGKVVSRVGIKHSMLLSVPFTVAYYIGLWQIEKFGIYAYFLTIFSALSVVFYWIAFHTDFSQFSERRKRGRQTSYMMLVTSFFASISPFLGGFIITEVGFGILFAVVAILLLVSMAPLAVSPDMREKYRDSYLTTFCDVAKRKYRFKTFAFVGEGSNKIAGGLVWPLYLFFIAISFKELGIIVSAALLVGMIFTFIMGYLADRYGARKMLKFGAFVQAVLWPARAFAHSPVDAFVIQSAHNGLGQMASVSFLTLFYNWAGLDGETRNKFVVFRELVMNGSAGIFLFIYAFVFAVIDLRWAFIITAFLSLLMVFMAFQSRTKKAHV